MTLDSLIEDGLISKQFMLFTGVYDGKPISEFLKMSEQERCLYTGVVTIDSPKWIATVMKKNPNEAMVVYTSDGSSLASWNSNKRSFSELTVTDNGLVVKSRKKFIKEDTVMSQLDELVAKGMSNATAPIEQSTAFSGEATKGKRELSPAAKYASDIMSKSDSSLNNDALIHLNRTHGRLQGYVVDHNESIRVAKSKVPIMDTDGLPKLRPGASADSVAKRKEGKNFSNADKEMEQVIKFRQAKPGPIKLVMYTQPAGGQVPLSYILSGKGDEMADLNNTTLKRVVAPIESFYAIIQSQFGGTILEDENILGNNASKVVAVSRVSVPKKPAADGKEVCKIKTTLKLAAGKDAKRKSLIVPGNYFPMSVFDTLGTQNMTEEDAQILNCNIEATIKNIDGYAEYSAETKAAIKFDPSVAVNETRVAVTSDYFKTGAATPIDVAAYYDKNTKLTSIQVPKRVKVQSKDGTKCVYKFIKIKAGEAGGPQEIEDYKSFVEKAGYKMDEFLALASEKISSAKGSSSTGGSKNNLSAEAYLRQRFSAKSSNITSVDSKLNVADIDALF